MKPCQPSGEGQPLISPDKQQIAEFLSAAFEELVRVSGRLRESRRFVDEHARNLETTVQEHTQQLLQIEKLAAMGALLAGVTHELKNSLLVLLGQTALLREAASGSPMAGRAEKIVQAAERCARIVRNVLTMARQRPPERGEARLNQLVGEAMELLSHSLQVDRVEVELDLADDLPLLWADPHELSQVVINLANNARQAMGETPPPRRLTLITRHDPTGRRVSLQVADTGPGIPPEIQGRIFEPFFTTKPLGQGTGLGLSLCQGIVEGHGGTIRVASQPGQGAVFRVELPVVAPLGTP